jgi:hypothetical protein
MKSKEAGERNEKAERCRQNVNKADEIADKRQLVVDKYKIKLKRLERQKRQCQDVLQKVSADHFDENVGGFEIEMKDILEGLEKEKVDFIKIRKDATEVRESYIRCAADLFLNAAQRGLSEAQFRMGQLYIGQEKLPDSWIPQTEDEIEDKDRAGLRAYRLSMQELRLQEEEERKNKNEPFSFQGQIEDRVKEMKKLTALQFKHVAVLSSKHARILLALDPPPDASKKKKETPVSEGHVRSHVAQTPATPKTAATQKTADSSKSSKSTFKFEVLSMDDYAREDFLAWRKKRMRIERAAFWFRKGADMGHPESKVELGILLKTGYTPGDDPRKDSFVPFPRNVEQAAYAFKEAAELGNRRGQYEYGKCLLAGSGVPVNQAQAVSWLKKSADQVNCSPCAC